MSEKILIRSSSMDLNSYYKNEKIHSSYQTNRSEMNTNVSKFKNRFGDGMDQLIWLCKKTWP